MKFNIEIEGNSQYLRELLKLSAAHKDYDLCVDILSNFLDGLESEDLIAILKDVIHPDVLPSPLSESEVLNYIADSGKMSGVISSDILCNMNYSTSNRGRESYDWEDFKFVIEEIGIGLDIFNMKSQGATNKEFIALYNVLRANHLGNYGFSNYICDELIKNNRVFDYSKTANVFHSLFSSYTREDEDAIDFKGLYELLQNKEEAFEFPVKLDVLSEKMSKDLRQIFYSLFSASPSRNFNSNDFSKGCMCSDSLLKMSLSDTEKGDDCAKYFIKIFEKYFNADIIAKIYKDDGVYFPLKNIINTVSINDKLEEYMFNLLYDLKDSGVILNPLVKDNYKKESYVNLQSKIFNHFYFVGSRDIGLKISRDIYGIELNDSVEFSDSFTKGNNRSCSVDFKGSIPLVFFEYINELFNSSTVSNYKIESVFDYTYDLSKNVHDRDIQRIASFIESWIEKGFDPDKKIEGKSFNDRLKKWSAGRLGVGKAFTDFCSEVSTVLDHNKIDNEVANIQSNKSAMRI